MASEPSASVIINNYNYARFLPDAIESALTQTHRDTQVIVVDDGSTDESKQVIDRYSNRITSLHKENGGQGSACNAGFALSSGDFVIFLDSDDVLLPTAAAAAALNFHEPGVSKVHWPLWEMDEAGRRTGRVIPGGELAEGDLRDEVIRLGPTSRPNAPTSGSAWPRTFLEQVLPVPAFNDGHGADAYLFTLAPIYGLIRRVAEPQGCYRVHSSSFSRRTVDADLRRDLGRYRNHCKVLAHHLRRMGIAPDLEAWTGPHSAYAWMQEMLSAPDQIARVVPYGAVFILVDEDQLGKDFVAGRRALPFPEKDGEFSGTPSSDEEAIGELERLREAGAQFIVFVSSTFWWLDYFDALSRHLGSRYRRVYDASSVLIYDLSQRRGA